MFGMGGYSSSHKIICVDFDGVLHQHRSPWRSARIIPDPPVPGALEWLIHMLETYCDVPDSIAAMAPPGEFTLCIFSARSRHWGGRAAMKRWLVHHGLDYRYLEILRFPLFKPPLHLLIDDRAFHFQGTFPTVEYIRTFTPWNK